MPIEASSPAAGSLQATAALSPSASRLDSILFYGVFGLLMFGPLAFGGVEAWSILILETVAAVLFALWTFRQAQSGQVQVLPNPLFSWSVLAGLRASPVSTKNTRPSGVNVT